MALKIGSAACSQVFVTSSSLHRLVGKDQEVEAPAVVARVVLAVKAPAVRGRVAAGECHLVLPLTQDSRLAGLEDREEQRNLQVPAGSIGQSTHRVVTVIPDKEADSVQHHPLQMIQSGFPPEAPRLTQPGAMTEIYPVTMATAMVALQKSIIIEILQRHT